MLLKNKQDGALIEIQDTITLINPFESQVKGCIQEGQEEQNLEKFAKNMLIFPSGENLPRCWVESNG